MAAQSLGKIGVNVIQASVPCQYCAIQSFLDRVKRFLTKERSAFDILKNMNEIYDLGDIIYDVREREGQGWDGPRVKTWGDLHERMIKLLENG